jgi:hypothetical protein
MFVQECYGIARSAWMELAHLKELGMMQVHEYCSSVILGLSSKYRAVHSAPHSAATGPVEFHAFSK